MPVMASLFVAFGLPSPSLSFPPHDPSGSWLALSQSSPRMMAVSVISFPPPELKRASFRVAALLHGLGQRQANALEGRSSWRRCSFRTFPVEGAAAFTTGDRSLDAEFVEVGQGDVRDCGGQEGLLGGGRSFLLPLHQFDDFLLLLLLLSGSRSPVGKIGIPLAAYRHVDDEVPHRHEEDNHDEEGQKQTVEETVLPQVFAKGTLQGRGDGGTFVLMYFLGFVNRFFGVFRLLIHGLKLVGLSLGKLTLLAAIGQEIDDLSCYAGYRFHGNDSKDLQKESTKDICFVMKSSFLGKQISGVGFFLTLLCFPGSQYGESNSTGLPEIKKAGEGLYRFGEVLIDRKGGKISFPAVSNQVNGLIEYGVVHETGKIHESLFERPFVLKSSIPRFFC